ncbi:hypothetical protein HYPSUDRAFT_202281 [Hypholoma sublateritium FD-334 SS-4]|uniref:Uncharacterized protein n=1 Tax=Hypholoma sublateritium (strain FD-334 SS-4) TaxID=945553 RepID=A0A0D2P0N1_HYPSF|nr:hypothetical protein HYPSUDRAFT_202281 [Hypholoma sublateritium FD-334 SS-4]
MRPAHAAEGRVGTRLWTAAPLVHQADGGPRRDHLHFFSGRVRSRAGKYTFLPPPAAVSELGFLSTVVRTHVLASTPQMPSPHPPRARAPASNVMRCAFDFWRCSRCRVCRPPADTTPTAARRRKEGSDPFVRFFFGGRVLWDVRVPGGACAGV